MNANLDQNDVICHLEGRMICLTLFQKCL